jgi:hypothetical protein
MPQPVHESPVAGLSISGSPKVIASAGD